MKDSQLFTYIIGLMLFSTLSGVEGENHNWHVQLDCSEDKMISSPPSCGTNIETPCCNLQEVLNHVEDGDTVYLRQVAATEHSWCNQCKEINITVTKPIILQTKQPDPTEGGDSIDRIHGVQLIFNNNCLEWCTIEISNSQFVCSLITFNHLNIRIENSMFKNSFITAKSHPILPAADNDIMIGKTVFKNNYSVGGRNESIIMNTESCKQRNYIYVTGQWNSIEILKSNLEGDRQSKVSGVEVMHANIETLNLIDVQVSFMFNALVVAPSSRVGIFNVTKSIFLGNRDGIDIGQGIRHVEISRSEMNYTGSWFNDEQVLEQCSSAFRGIAQIVKVEESVFAHNRASGMNCKGVALYLGTSVYKTLLLPSNNITNKIHNQLIHTIEVVKSVFYANMLENCSLGFSGSVGGAIAVYGLQLWIKIVASNFVQNEACKGAGVYMGLSDRWQISSLPNDPQGHIMSSKLIIDRCTFTENIAEFGGALMAELTESLLGTGSTVSTLIYNSSFIGNNAIKTGAGAYLKLVNVSIDSGVGVIISMRDSDFRKNINTGEKDPDGKGGGMYVELTFVSLTSNASVKTMVKNCTFTSNTAIYWAGIHTEVDFCSLDFNSSIMSQVTGSTFSNNTAWWTGAGISTRVESCSVDSNSYIMSHVTGSTFTNNTAEYGAGIFAEVWSCSVDSNSSIMTQVIGSTFTNTAERGAGICTEVWLCSVDSNSSIMSQVIGSTFTNNTAESGAGIFTGAWSCSVDSNSFIMSGVTGSIFTTNTAERYGAGIYTRVKSCSVDSNSYIMSQVTGSTFTNNTAEYGAGISIEVWSCSVDSNSSIMSQVTGSTFTNNTAEHAAGMIHTWMGSCSVDRNSSIMSQVIGSTFTNNTAEYGAGIYTDLYSCSINSNSSVMLLTTHSKFTLNTVERYGAGIFAYLGSCSVDSTSSFTIQILGSIFSSNSAERGASLSVLQNTEDTCVSGELTVDIDNCRFINNSASKEGGSLYLNVFLITQVYVRNSIFNRNKALPGSGLYRESVNVQSCDNTTCYQATKALIKTQIFQSHFIDNIDTAILVKNKQRYGILTIKRCSFINNRCINLSFAEDIFTDMDLELSYTNIVKNKTFSRTIGINSQSDATLRNVTVDTSVLSIEKQIIVAVFSHYITQGKHPSFRYHCPAFYQPMLSTAGLTDTGAVMVRATCDTCFEGYYTGETWMATSAEDNSDYHCTEKQNFDIYARIMGKTRFCYTVSLGICNKCPHGGNCSAGVLSLPNYWGHVTATDRLEFHRCPVGYCCNQAQCDGIGQCATHREGRLCGHCMKGFSESLLSAECLPDENCKDIWLLPLFILWGFLVTQILIFMGKFEKLGNRLLEIFRHFISKWKTANSSKDQSNEPDERQKTKPFITKITIVESDCIPKVPILWGLLATQRPQRAEPSGSHKYLQIILYYLQDAALMQVDLAIGSSGSTIQKIRKLLLNVSQLAVDMLDLGLKLCPIQGWTPVVKLVTKNLTGPLVFCFVFAIYVAANISSKYCSNRKQSIRLFWYPKLTSATIFALLLFYQQIANTTFSLLYCIKSDDQSILFIDGTVTCYKPWQILIHIFAFNWVIAIIPVLMFLPGLLELRLISVTDFFLACLLPGPMLCYWVYKFYTKKFCFHPSYVTPWQDEALGILQKTFVPTTYRNMFPFCWLGFMKIRRLALVLIFTFVSNLVGRVALMCIVIMLFLIIHLETKPYQDKMANNAYTASLLATLCIGLINIMKASCVEFYLDLDKVKHSLENLNLITDVIFVYCPPAFIVLAIITIVWRKFRTSMRKKKGKE